MASWQELPYEVKRTQKYKDPSHHEIWRMHAGGFRLTAMILRRKWVYRVERNVHPFPLLSHMDGNVRELASVAWMDEVKLLAEASLRRICRAGLVALPPEPASGEPHIRGRAIELE